MLSSEYPQLFAEILVTGSGGHECLHQRTRPPRASRRAQRHSTRSPLSGPPSSYLGQCRRGRSTRWGCDKGTGIATCGYTVCPQWRASMLGCRPRFRPTLASCCRSSCGGRAGLTGSRWASAAAAPDLAYLLDGSGLPVWPLSHEPLGLLVWCVPVTVVVAWMLRRAAPVVAVHLPRPGCACVTTARSGTTRTGGSSRRHRRLSAARAIWPPTAWEPGYRLPSWRCTCVGALMLLLTMRHVARHALIRRWHGPPPAVSASARAVLGDSPGGRHGGRGDHAVSARGRAAATPPAYGCSPWRSVHWSGRRRVPPARPACARQDGSRD